MTVIRVKHTDRYVVIKKTALEDPTLSFKAKGLWAYCMSRPNDWEFNITHLATVSKEKEVAIYSAIKELIDAGYAVRNQENKGKGEGGGRGCFGKTDYIIYEDRQIQNSFTLRGFVDAGNVDACNQGQLSIDKKLSNEKEKKKDSVAPGASRLSSLLLDSIKKTVPDLKQPDMDRWNYEIDKMLRLDGRSVQKTEELLEWLPKNDFWSAIILNAKKFREKYDQLSAEMNKKTKLSISAEDNKALAIKVIQRYLVEAEKNHIQMQDDSLLFSYTGTWELLKFEDREFRTKLFNRLNKMNLSTQGL